MPEDIELDEYGNPVEEEDEPNPRDLRTQRKKAVERAEAAEARARNAELKVAMAENGVPLNARTKWVLAHYDGDTDPEAVKSFLVEHEFLEESEPAPSGEGEAHQRISEAASGGEATHLQSDEEKAHAEIRALIASGVKDPFLLEREGTAIMQKYNQPMSFGDDDGVFTERG